MDDIIKGLWERAKSRKRSGILLILVGVLFVWYNWDAIEKLPGVAQSLGAVESLSYVEALFYPLPIPDKTRLSIGILNLSDDETHQVENVITQDLNDIPPLQEIG